MSHVPSLLLADWFFTLLHLAVIGFNLFGWISPKTRRLHRWCVAITAFCWIVIGWWVGRIGYCPLTEWHYRIKYLRGARHLPPSYIGYLLERIGIYMRPDHVDVMTGTAFGFVVIITLVLWWQERRGRGFNR
jgi:hypothetical protein